MSECAARATQDGYRCERCRIQWDRDDTAPPCPIESPPLVPESYVSALAPRRI